MLSATPIILNSAKLSGSRYMVFGEWIEASPTTLYTISTAALGCTVQLSIDLFVFTHTNLFFSKGRLVL